MVLDTMVPVREFLRLFFLENKKQNDLGGPRLTCGRRREIGTERELQQRRRRAMAGGSPRQYDGGELSMALQARAVRSLTSLFSSNAREIQRYTRENGPFSARPENLKNNRTPANLGCFDASGYRTFHSACVRNFPDALLGFKKSKRDRT